MVQTVREMGEIEQTPHYQYFVDKTIKLQTFDRRRGSTTPGDDGELIRDNLQRGEEIEIVRLSQGVVSEKFYDDVQDSYHLYISFTNEPDNPVLHFMASGGHEGNRFLLVLDDKANGIVKYGNNSYSVYWEGDETYPSLLVRLQERLNVTNGTRTEPGRPIRN
jgi:hypothetical protein